MAPQSSKLHQQLPMPGLLPMPPLISPACTLKIIFLLYCNPIFGNFVLYKYTFRVLGYSIILRLKIFRRSADPLIHRTTVLPSYRPTVLPSYRPTVQPSYRPTVLPSYRSTVLPFYRSTVLPFYRSTVLPFYRLFIKRNICYIPGHTISMLFFSNTSGCIAFKFSVFPFLFWGSSFLLINCFNSLTFVHSKEQLSGRYICVLRDRQDDTL